MYCSVGEALSKLGWYDDAAMLGVRDNIDALESRLGRAESGAALASSAAGVVGEAEGCCGGADANLDCCSC